MATSDERRKVEEKKKEKMNWYEGVPAPMDADGREIPLDTAVLYNKDGNDLHTDRATYMRRTEDWWFFGYFGSHTDTHRIAASDLYLNPPDSLEKLSDDLERYDDNKVVCEYFGMTVDGTCDGCRAHNCGLSCIGFALDDVARRVRALREAERDGD